MRLFEEGDRFLHAMLDGQVMPDEVTRRVLLDYFSKKFAHLSKEKQGDGSSLFAPKERQSPPPGPIRSLVDNLLTVVKSTGSADRTANYNAYASPSHWSR